MRRLGVRLFLSYLAVVIASTGVAFAAARALAPTLLRESIVETAGEGAAVAVVTQPSDSSTSTPPASPPKTDPAEGPDPSTGAEVAPPTAANGTNDQAPGNGTTGSSDQGHSGSTSSTSAPTTSSQNGHTGPTDRSHAGGSEQQSPGTGNGPDASVARYVLTAGVLAAPVFAATQMVVDPTATAAFLTAFDNALLFASSVAFVVALASSWLMSRRIMRPVAAVREATVRLADGDYRHHVPVPAETELAALAHDVNVLADRLSTTEERRTRLIADVAHELRTPLTTIQGSMEALIDGVMQPSEKVFNSVADEAARLQRIVSDLGLLSRIDEGVLDLDRQPIDLGTIARTVAERLRPQFDDQGVELRLDLVEGLGVSADADRMAQVFTNVIGNALAHSPTSSTVTISGRSLDTGQVEISIIDEGDGIEESELEAIFERFRRGAGTKRPGSGLGLSIAQSLVHAHDGSLKATSSGVGLGSTFTVRLPARTTAEWSS